VRDKWASVAEARQGKPSVQRRAVMELTTDEFKRCNLVKTTD